MLSFDLVSDGAYVIEADICSRIPLPGSEPSSEGEGEAQIVDVVVCALSLMGTNWPGCIREAWRILKPGYVVVYPLAATSYSWLSQWRAEDSRGDKPVRECGRIYILRRLVWFQAEVKGEHGRYMSASSADGS